MNNKTVRFALFSLLISLFGTASADVLWQTEIKRVYAQSRDGSTAHMIQVDQTLEDCYLDRLYIRFEDKEVFSSALANKIAGNKVDIIYTTTAEPIFAEGHIANFTCKVISLF